MENRKQWIVNKYSYDYQNGANRIAGGEVEGQLILQGFNIYLLFMMPPSWSKRMPITLLCSISLLWWWTIDNVSAYVLRALFYQCLCC